MICLVVRSMDRARRRAEENALEADRQSERLRTTLRSIGDAVIVADDGGRVVSLNPVAEALTGWTDEEAAGRRLVEVFRVEGDATGAGASDSTERTFRDLGHGRGRPLVARRTRRHPPADRRDRRDDPRRRRQGPGRRARLPRRHRAPRRRAAGSRRPRPASARSWITRPSSPTSRTITAATSGATLAGAACTPAASSRRWARPTSSSGPPRPRRGSARAIASRSSRTSPCRLTSRRSAPTGSRTTGSRSSSASATATRPWSAGSPSTAPSGSPPSAPSATARSATGPSLRRTPCPCGSTTSRPSASSP